MRKKSLKYLGAFALAMILASGSGAQSFPNNSPVTIAYATPPNTLSDFLTNTYALLLGGSSGVMSAAIGDFEWSSSIFKSGTDGRFQTASIALGGLPIIDPLDVIPLCIKIKQPPMMLQTQSKYKQDDSSKSTVDDNALADRNKIIQPIRNAVRQLTGIAYASSESPLVLEANAECVLSNVDRWASAKSLTEMQSTDAFLSRDRWFAEITLAVLAASKIVGISDERKTLYGAWFGAVANDTVQAFSLRLGPKSRTNNHRYWAGLSVAAVGFLLNDQKYKSWGKTSFEIGACQVDSHGLLPIELARGEKALDYHVYALRPLAAIIKLFEEHGEPLQSKCLDGFRRLTVMTREALQNPTEFERIAGMRQSTTAQESSYSAALTLKSLSVL